MSIIDSLNNKNVWQEFLEYKLTKCSMIRKEKEQIIDYVENEKYLKISNEIIEGTYTFSIPQKKLVNKIDKAKKRIVYTYNEDETMILKLISYLLYKYDYVMPSNCYSFRKNYGVKQAINKLTHHENINEMYGYKIDIENYFNSVNVELLMPVLGKILYDDEPLYKLIKSILENEFVISKDEIIKESKGIMAGIPISAFLANIYLKDVDEYFEKNEILYARYSDDIIMFGSEIEINEYIKILERKIKEHKLNINEKKKEYFKPGVEWDFLGFSYKNGTIDLSQIAKKKIKGKIRRSARKIRRWMLRKEASPDRAIKAMNKKFNYKFFSKNEVKDLSWSNWYFPIINTGESLEEIDHYMQEYLRYIATGKFNKKNYEKVSYEFLKECYYKPLVSEYYTKKDEDSMYKCNAHN